MVKDGENCRITNDEPNPTCYVDPFRRGNQDGE